MLNCLSDTEFLLFQGPWSGPGIAWEETIRYIQALHDIWDWGGTEVTVVIAQHTMRQSRIDLANTCEYRWARVLGRLATVEGRARTLALDSPRPVSPQGRGRGYTWRADRYYAQKAVRALAMELTLNAVRLATPEDYHSTWEPSEFKYESEGLEGPGTDSMGCSSTATATSYHDTDNTNEATLRIELQTTEAKTLAQKGALEYKCPETEGSQEWLGGAASIPGIHQGRSPHLYRLVTGGRGIHHEEVPRA